MTKPWEKKIPDTENQALNAQISVSKDVTQILEEGRAHQNQVSWHIGHQHTVGIVTEPVQCTAVEYLQAKEGIPTVQGIEEQFESHPSETVIEGQPHDYLNKIVEWNYINDQISALKKKEMELRNELTSFYFPEPSEGTNTTDLPDAWKLKAVFKYNRNIDKAALPAVLEKLPEGTEDKVIEYKPSLKLKNYKGLIEDHKKIFDEALIIKPGTPSMELVPPKEPKK